MFKCAGNSLTVELKCQIKLKILPDLHFHPLPSAFPATSIVWLVCSEKNDPGVEIFGLKRRRRWHLVVEVCWTKTWTSCCCTVVNGPKVDKPLVTTQTVVIKIV